MIPGIVAHILQAAGGTTYHYELNWSGVSNQGYTDEQTIDVASEGWVSGNNWRVEENDGVVEVLSNALKFTGQTTPANFDCGIFGQTAITTELGLVFKASMPTANQGSSNRVGFNSTIDSLTTHHMQDFAGEFSAAAGVRAPAASGSSAQVKKVVVMYGGYNSSGIPYKNGDTASSFLYGCRVWVLDTTFHSGKYALGSVSHLNTAASVYPGVSCWNNPDQYTSISVPSSYTITGTLIQPEHLSLFEGHSVNDGLNSVYTPDVGGDWANDNAVIKAGNTAQFTTAGECTITYTSSGLIEADIKMPASGTTKFGIVYRWSDSSNYWYLRITPGGGSNNFEIGDVVSGTWTARLQSTQTLSASTSYKIAVSFFNDNYRSYAINSSYKGENKATNTFNNTATSSGIKDEGTTNGTFEYVAFYDSYNTTLDTEFDALT